VAEGVHGGLHRFQVRPHLDVVEQFPLQCLVEPLDLARRGGRAGLGVAGDDAVLPADAFEQHLPGAGFGESAGELFAVISQDFLRDTEGAQRLGEGRADRPAGGPAHHGGDDAEPGMVVHAGDHLGLAAVGQLDAANDVQLP
jgi:hypothetical protein